jgi:hypothetical protein
MLLRPLRSYSPPAMASGFPIGNTFPPHPAPLSFSTTATGNMALQATRTLPMA